MAAASTLCRVSSGHLSTWDLRFLDMAKVVSTYSKDPSTKTGAVIADSLNRIVSQGYNGFPRGVVDSEERLFDRKAKYARIVHADVNAVLNAGRSVSGCSMYLHPFLPCSECAKIVIQAGITRVVSWDLVAGSSLAERWAETCDLALEMFSEAGVSVVMVSR